MTEPDQNKNYQPWRDFVLDFPKRIPKALGFAEGEEPLYFVLDRKGGKEIRDYKPFVVAYTEVKNTPYENAGISGYLKLSKYFSGENLGARPIQKNAPKGFIAEKGEKLILTTPIFQFAAYDYWKVALMLPSRFSLETAPLPLEPSIKLAQIPESVVAAIKIQGSLSQDKMENKTSDLREWIRNYSQFQASSAPYIAHLDLFPTFPIFRKTEILIGIDGRR